MTEISVSPLIQQMLQPDFYPHPVTEPIQLIQTHVSSVLLTGEYVYKVKKPVNFGFLNFSTLELREHFCKEEIRLNQRGAGELYLEVVPIFQTGDRFHLNGSGEVGEWVLKMRQFPQEGLFSEIFQRGELQATQMEELGKTLAQFHSEALINDYIRSFGEIRKIQISFEENYQQTLKYIGGPQTQAQFEQTKAYSDRFFIERQELFASRVKNNWIRECHGDLHLRNICLWQGKTLLFDCIEFNEPFRFVDVMYDVAFAVMDIEARGRKDLANAFLNAYVEQTGDWEGLQILPLYLSRQAYVRAKVISFLLDDPAVPTAEKEAAAKTASEYYQLSWSYTQPRPGKLYLMSGLSGSGKSTAAKQVARQEGAIHIRSDAARKHLGGIPLYEKGTAELYSPEMTEKTYSRLLELGILLANQGFSVILDAKYDREKLRQEAIAQATSHQIPLEILYCSAPIEVLRDRLLARTGDIADATADLLESQQAAFEPFTEAERLYVKEWQ